MTVDGKKKLPKSTQKTNGRVFLGCQVEGQKSWGCLGEAAGCGTCCLNITPYKQTSTNTNRSGPGITCPMVTNVCLTPISTTYVHFGVAGYYSFVWKTIVWSGNFMLKILNEPCTLP